MSSALQVVPSNAGQGSAIPDIAVPEIPGYRIQRLVAEGGMASVFLALQESLDRPVALKLLKRFDDPTVAERFPNEGRVIASLSHRNIITIHDLGVVGERHYISMEYLEGGTLQDKIAAGGLKVHQALDLVEQLGECLEFAHRKGVVHRDIKPANILFRNDDTPVLSDFGIAKRREANAELTIAGTALGSPYYLSPEQAEGVPLDGRTDLYSLGVVLFELLTGERPYEHESAIQVILGHVTQPVPRLPASLACYQAFLDRLMAKDRHQRFPTAGAMVRKLRSLRGSQPILERRARPALIEATIQRPARRRRLWLSLACAAVPILAVSLYAALPAPLSPSVLPVPAAAVDPSVLPQHPKPAAPEATQPDQAPVSAQLGFELWEIPPFAEDSGAGQQTSSSAGMALADDPMLVGPPLDGEAVEQIPVEQDPPTVPSLMVRADQALRAYRLTTPRNDNAYAYYRQVLTLEPGHAEARRGIGAVVDAYAKLAENALRQNRDDLAQRYVDRGLAVDDRHALLMDLSRRLEQPAADPPPATKQTRPRPVPEEPLGFRSQR